MKVDLTELENLAKLKEAAVALRRPLEDFLSLVAQFDTTTRGTPRKRKQSRALYLDAIPSSALPIKNFPKYYYDSVSDRVLSVKGDKIRILKESDGNRWIKLHQGNGRSINVTMAEVRRAMGEGRAPRYD